MKKILLVALMSTLLATACSESEETIVDEQEMGATGYTDDAINISDVELNSTPTDTNEQSEGEKAADSAADMVGAMQNTLDSMSGTMVDTVESIKKGATETKKDITQELDAAAASMADDDAEKDSDEAEKDSDDEEDDDDDDDDDDDILVEGQE